MPVPVPLYTKQPAHPVIKPTQSGDADYKPSLFQHVTHSLPLPPRGPPPSFATREEWISSLPDWRRNKPRAIWEDDNIRHHSSTGGSSFHQGLTVAGNAAVIKGAPAQACIPPVSTLIVSANFAAYHGMYPSPAEEADDEMSPIEEEDGWRSNGVSPVTYSDSEMRAQDSDTDSLEFSSDYQNCQYIANDENIYPPQSSIDRGMFSPLHEETSPNASGNNDPSSSPIGPATPFEHYVDRAVADAQNTLSYSSHRHPVDVVSQNTYTYEDYCNNQCYQCQQYDQQVHQAIQPAAEPSPTPSANDDYKKLAEPLSEWMASFVWKVCTTGAYIKHAPPRDLPNRHYSHAPPSSLARNIHSLFMSTLLQPSAIFLAMHYIVNLPVYFGPCQLGFHHEKEMRFRQELLGEPHSLLDRDDSYAPFRLILLGCMLANKWLDDHTFSNKTWHSISSVPIQSLNRDWSQWLECLKAYHMSLSSPTFPQPISRPSTSPHMIIRRSIDTLIQANSQWQENPQHPVFLGLDEKRKADEQLEQVYDVDVLDIDLDEEGPLRLEYVPKRRVSGAGSARYSRSQERAMEPERRLPPPARWSPAGDELINPKAQSHQYMAPQPIMHMSAAPMLPPFRDTSQHPGWPWGPVHDYAPPPPPMFASQQSAYNYGYAPPPAPLSHSRSQSLSYNPAVAGSSQGHYRSYSQTRYEGFHETQYTEPHYVAPLPPPVSNWGHFERPNYIAAYERPIEFRNRIPLKV
ncbi:unnamed protein product [Somion occarium]|uniref:Transcription factor domain-containing protein n=1 Tax=Somion occarium TaxID=3059160 RepID=A0ABP1CZ23_9APHY